MSNTSDISTTIGMWLRQIDWSEWWHIPLVLTILLFAVLTIALLASSFYVIHKVNYLREDLLEMDETFLKTLSEHDRSILEHCVRLSYQQTREQVSKLWNIYIQKEEQIRKHNDENLNFLQKDDAASPPIK